MCVRECTYETKRHGEIKREGEICACMFIELWLQAVSDWDLDNGTESLIEKTNILQSVTRTMWTTQHATRHGADGHTRTHTNIHERSCWSLCQRYNSLRVTQRMNSLHTADSNQYLDLLQTSAHIINTTCILGHNMCALSQNALCCPCKWCLIVPNVHLCISNLKKYVFEMDSSP